jgi:hypothetical protein
MEALYPEFCQEMQMKIIGILLKDVYITPDTCLQKSRILVRKGRALRVCGIEGLKDCIQCLSDSISTIVSFFFFPVASSLIKHLVVNHLFLFGVVFD